MLCCTQLGIYSARNITIYRYASFFKKNTYFHFSIKNTFVLGTSLTILSLSCISIYIIILLLHIFSSNTYATFIHTYRLDYGTFHLCMFAALLSLAF